MNQTNPTLAIWERLGLIPASQQPTAADNRP
jgi:hypothetical protein